MQDLGTITPSREEFRARAAGTRVIPVHIKILADSLTPIGIYRSLVLQDDQGASVEAAHGTFLLESATISSEGESASWARYSFIGASSRSTLTTVDGAVHWQGRTPAGAPVDGDPVEAIAKTLQMLYTEPDPTLPPLTSGLVGYLGWDVVRHWENLPNPPADDVKLPEFALNMVSDMAIHDNQDGTVLLVANAINFNGTSENVDGAYDDAVARLHSMLRRLQRGATREEDVALAEELLADQKERSEHLMLVDLARNDLSRIAKPGTVSVDQFMIIERFSHIMHISSAVSAELDPQFSAYDVLRVAFPAGTLSGAPKPRAMQLIDEYEPTRRGVYGGVCGYFDFAGNMDMAIAIRTAVLKEGTAYVQAGAGLVMDSNPDSETLETVNKSAAPLRAVLTASGLAPLDADAAVNAAQ